jgi:hypothetical protein
VGLLCYAAGNVKFAVKLPPTGYDVINNDVLSLTIDVQNNCMRGIEMRADILQKVTMFA